MSSINVESHINSSDNWGLSQLKNKASLNNVVSIVHFAAHQNIDNEGADGQPATNHWSIYLETDSVKSVRVEVVPSGPRQPGMILLENKTYAVTDNNVNDVACTAQGSPTVRNILELIISKGRDQYIFTPVGEGCRFWVSTFAGDLGGASIITNEDKNAVQEAVKYFWKYPKGSGSETRVVQEGNFF